MNKTLIIKYGIRLLEDEDNAKNASTSFQQLATQHLIEFDRAN